MTQEHHGDTPAEAAHRRRNEYDAAQAEREEAERVTPYDNADALREHLWLNGRLPAGSVPQRFQVQKSEIGPFYRMICTDLVTGRAQEFLAGQWNFLEAWMSEQEERS